MRMLIRCGALGSAVVLAAFGGVMAVGRRRFDRAIVGRQEALLGAARATDAATITEERLAPLPEPVQRYLRHAQVVGRTIPRTVHLTQRGRMHPGANGPWLPLAATQVYSVDPPGFVWAATVRVGPLPIIRGCDSLLGGMGHMDIRAGSLMPIVDEKGPEMDQASLLRHLSEMVWFPMAFLAPNVSFAAIDEHHADVSIVDGDRRASGTMTFDDEGRLLDFVALRHRLVGGSHVPTMWSTPMTEYGELAGLRLPVRGKAVWKLPEGDLEYIDVEITSLRLDAPAAGGA